ncbi:MAG: phenylalanine--tRNA ligase subunit beta [Candidatus Levybacteria bacterium]|nr:phenylalanine--tRNA ligase subunit beta [Candidatus Levybacteria bacterium]
MIAPLSWLKEYVEITLTSKELREKLTEVGLGCEKITKTSDDTIFELEITPNRPDLLSIIGVAREIAAMENKSIRYPEPKTTLKPSSHLPGGKLLPLIIKTDPEINPRFTGVIVSGIKIGESPKWLKDKLSKMGQRSVNNIVDITNFVMLELGNPIHAFDYDKIEGNIMIVSQAKGGERFESVDEIVYRLPKGAVVISDREKIIDLCGIKGGKNSGTYNNTRNIFIRVPVEVPNLIRRTSVSLGLRSEASSIFERGVNADGTIDALKRCVDLILEIAGGEVASNLYDIKSQEFKPWKLKLRKERLNQILGIEIPVKRLMEILSALNLSPILTRDVVEVTIPTYRNDLKIEEDLIEEVARIYGYNNFSKTIPIGEIPTNQIPYFKDYRLDEKVKNILKACGFSEIYTYSLIAEKDLIEGINSQNLLRVDNPVSRDFEYLRPTLKINLLKALSQNKSNFKKINLFELGKVYFGKNLDTATETYFLSGISNSKSFLEIKGLLEKVFEDFGVKEDPAKYIEILNSDVICFEFDFSEFTKRIKLNKKFIPLPKYPPIVEDLSIVTREDVKTADIIAEMKSQSSLIYNISLLDQYKNSRTFHIVYQHKERNLTLEEVSKTREKILKSLREKFQASFKQ